jgi:type II secretory pathway component GspD/PulD (secretin)
MQESIANAITTLRPGHNSGVRVAVVPAYNALVIEANEYDISNIRSLISQMQLQHRALQKKP